MKAIYFITVSFLLIKISVTDYKTYQIPLKYNLFLMVLGILRILYVKESITVYLAAFLLWWIFLGGVFRITKGEALGGGDVKLMMAAGLLLGVEKSIAAFFVGCVLAGIIEGVRCLGRRERGIFPMGPYLAAGIMMMLL